MEVVRIRFRVMTFFGMFVTSRRTRVVRKSRDTSCLRAAGRTESEPAHPEDEEHTRVIDAPSGNSDHGAKTRENWEPPAQQQHRPTPDADLEGPSLQHKFETNEMP